MLILSRKINESLGINDNIKITVVELTGNRVRLGIEAPSDISVRRTELSCDKFKSKSVRAPAEESGARMKWVESCFHEPHQ